MNQTDFQDVDNPFLSAYRVTDRSLQFKGTIKKGGKLCRMFALYLQNQKNILLNIFIVK